MASLFKRNRHEPFPNGTVVVERKGERLARWTDDKGKTREASLNSAADRIVLPPAKEDPYYVAYDDENGRRRTVKAYRDKESSEAMGKRLEDTVAKCREELRAFRPQRFLANQSVVRTVPSMKALRADLKLAGIEDVDAEGLFADLHGLGKSLITAMAANGVSQRAAMASARHTDPRLTASVYTDEALLPLAAEIGKVPRLPSLESHAPGNVAAGTSNGDGKDSNSHGQCAGTNGEASTTQGTGVARRSKLGPEDLQTPGKSAKDHGSRAAPAQRNRDFACHSGALRGTSGKGEPPARSGDGDGSQVSESNGVGTKWHDPAPRGTGSFLEAGEGGRTLDIHVGNLTRSMDYSLENAIFHYIMGAICTT